MALSDISVRASPREAAFDMAPPAAPAAVIDLRDFAGILKRQRFWILAPAVLCTAAAVIVSLLMPTRYTATAQILLDLQGLRVLQNDLTPRAEQSDSQFADAESQLQVITSGGVLTAVVEREKLQDDPDFGGAPPSLLTRLFGHVLTAPTEQDKILKAVNVLRDRVAVRRPDKTFVIDIAVWSGDRDKAARLANSIATVYLEQQLAAKTDAAKRTNAALVARLAELRERVAQSAHRVEDYKAQNHIVDAGGQLISEQQLAEINNQLVLAQTAVAEQKSRYDDIVKLQRERSEPDAIAEVIQSPTITALRTRYADVKRLWADESTTLGPRHPKVEAAAAQVAEVRGLIDAEVARIAKTALSDYNRAQANEAALEKKLQELQGEVTDTRKSLVRLRELEREADADRAIYDALLSRAKEVGEQEGVDNSNSRLITRAVAPLNKSGPPRLLIVAGALGAGLLAGFGLALVREQLAQPPLSARDPATDYGLRVLARLPGCDTLPAPVFPPRSLYAAAIRRLLDALELDRRRSVGATVVLFDSPDGPEARSIVALNLAICAGDEGKRVLFVEGDRAQAAATAAVRSDKSEPGERIVGRANRVFRTPWEGVRLMRIYAVADGEGESTDEACDALLINADDFDLVVIDGALVLHDPALRRFASFVDDVVMVIKNDRAVAAQIRKGLDVVGSDRAALAGIVLVG